MDIHRHGVVHVLVGIDQTDGKLVVGVGRQAVVDEKLGFGIEGLGVSLDQSVHLGAGGFRSGDRVSAGQA